MRARFFVLSPFINKNNNGMILGVKRAGSSRPHRGSDPLGSTFHLEKGDKSPNFGLSHSVDYLAGFLKIVDSGGDSGEFFRLAGLLANFHARTERFHGKRAIFHANWAIFHAQWAFFNAFHALFFVVTS